MSLSSESSQVLRFLREYGTDVVDDNLPEWISIDRLTYLVEQKLVLRLLYLPPGKEPQYPHGLNGYRITPAGLDALEEFERLEQEKARQAAQHAADQEAAQKREAQKERSNWARFLLGLLVGWLLGAFTPLDLWAVLTRSLDHLFSHLH